MFSSLIERRMGHQSILQHLTMETTMTILKILIQIMQMMSQATLRLKTPLIILENDWINHANDEPSNLEVEDITDNTGK